MKHIKSIDDLEEFSAATGEKPLFLFKHSTRCPVSTTALGEYREFLDASGDDSHALLDILEHRDVSDEIAARSGVTHQSPQALLYRNGEVCWNDSHGAITRDALAAAVAQYAG